MDKPLKASDLEWVTNGSAYNYDLMRKFIRGLPAATGKYTTEELDAMGIIGYYKIKGKE